MLDAQGKPMNVVADETLRNEDNRKKILIEDIEANYMQINVLL